MNYEYEELTPYDQINLIVITENVVRMEGLGRKINCIKTLRSFTGLGLKEAKWYVDYVFTEIRIKEAKFAYHNILDNIDSVPSEYLSEDEIESLQYCKRMNIKL